MRINILILIICLIISCKRENTKEKLAQNKIEEFKYLLNYIDDFKRNDTIMIDSFNFFYSQQKVLYLNDSMLVFANIFNNNKFLLFIYPDSISIYSGYVNLTLVDKCEVKNLLVKNKIEEAIKLIEEEYTILYKYNLGNVIINYIIYDQSRWKACYVFTYYQYFNQGNWFNWNFNYIRTIKNDFIQLDKIKFVNCYPYNISECKYLNIPKPRP